MAQPEKMERPEKTANESEASIQGHDLRECSENLRQFIPAVMIYKNRKNHWATEKGGE